MSFGLGSITEDLLTRQDNQSKGVFPEPVASALDKNPRMQRPEPPYDLCEPDPPADSALEQMWESLEQDERVNQKLRLQHRLLEELDAQREEAEHRWKQVSSPITDMHPHSCATMSWQCY